MHISSASVSRILVSGALLFAIVLVCNNNNTQTESVILSSDGDDSEDIRHEANRRHDDEDADSNSDDSSKSEKHSHVETKHERAKRMAKSRISTSRLVLDIKKVLLDVEATIKRRRERRQQNRDHHEADDERGHAQPTDEKTNLHEVDHIMDGLESLANVGHSHSRSSRDDDDYHHHTQDRRIRRHDADDDSGSDDDDSHKSREEGHNRHEDRKHNHDDEEGRLLRNLRAAQRTHSPQEQRLTPAQEEKRKQIADKMKALQEQIQHDFKKVTGFGNKAGYVPPPKIPSV